MKIYIFLITVLYLSFIVQAHNELKEISFEKIKLQNQSENYKILLHKQESAELREIIKSHKKLASNNFLPFIKSKISELFQENYKELNEKEFINGLENNTFIIQLSNLTISDKEEIYHTYVIKLNLPENVLINEYEVVSENENKLHHLMTFLKKNINYEKEVTYFIGSAPGFRELKFGTPIPLEKDSIILFEIHYTKNEKTIEDNIKVIIKSVENNTIKDGYCKRALKNIADHIDKKNFVIQPYEENYIQNTSWEIKDEINIYSILPHMHNRGKRFTAKIIYPNDTNKEILSIQNWDFNNQTPIIFKDPIVIPKGSIIEFTATFDNSIENPNNPDPSKQVKIGENSDDEMIDFFIDYCINDKINYVKILD